MVMVRNTAMAKDMGTGTDMDMDTRIQIRRNKINYH